MEEEDERIRAKLLKLLPTGMFVIWKMFENILGYFMKPCARIPLLVGAGVCTIACAVIPLIHHDHEQWTGYLFHSLSATIAFLSLVLTSPQFACFFHWREDLFWLRDIVNTFVPLLTWGIICFLSLLLHQQGFLRMKPKKTSYHKLPEYL